MKKLLILPFLLATLQAQDFVSFLADSLAKSPRVQTNALTLKQAQQKAELTTRYENPTLSVELSSFNPDAGKSELGYRGGISQPLRLWGVGSARETLAEAQKSEARASVKLSRANFIQKIASLYALYKYAKNAQELAREELLIAQNIATISQARFENGTIAKVKYIQATLDVKRVQNTLAQKKVATTTAYYQLMGFRALNETVELDTDYNFSLAKENENRTNAQIELSKAQKEAALASSKLNANKLEWISLNGEFEKEPEQSIARVSIDIPLVLFNTKSQEKQIAKFEAQKAQLLTENLTQQMHFKLRELRQAIDTLTEVEQTSQELLTSQKELLSMYEEGYKIANINLIELQTIKNQLIETKENLLNIRLQKELQIIQHNYLTGSYNE